MISECPARLACRGLDIGTHHFLAVSLRGHLSIVPYEQYDQEERQHVEIPVPHCEHKDLEEKTDDVSERVYTHRLRFSLPFSFCPNEAEYVSFRVITP